MKDLWQSRLERHLKEQSKFLRLVFNEYFIIAIIFMIGALGFWYSKALTHLAPHTWWTQPVAIIVLIILALWFQVATLMQPADTTFLLPKEQELKQYLLHARNYSLILPLLGLCIGNFLLTPFWARGAGFQALDVLAVAVVTLVLEIGVINNRLASFYVTQRGQLLGESLVSLLVTLGITVYINRILGIVLAVILCLASFYQLSTLMNQRLLNWNYLVQQEQQRSYQIKRFYNLFTDVPGMSSKVRRYRFLDVFFKPISTKQTQTSLYLFARGFVRNTEYSSLFLRLTVLSLLLIAFLKNVWLITVIASLFLYLVEFQLIPLYKSYDTNVLFQIYPLTSVQKQHSFVQLLTVILVVQWFLDVLVLVLVYHLSSITFISGGLSLLVTICLLLYLPHQLQKIER
ncbi:ABC transporter permease [Bombilactobacillus folatiphilus]|uniref:ABC transporter permease n=1 Tax=Bombilactobacillus folatiphilus TaxID=2923362 RepID=A0ABY4PB17_9LACO|nr:ABC transporter permease [Bombilactobacillus folatiphilus]UQS82877.1 ABC transporter permease [Bombilactobacillus folatiphilus]